MVLGATLNVPHYNICQSWFLFFCPKNEFEKSKLKKMSGQINSILLRIPKNSKYLKSKH